MKYIIRINPKFESLRPVITQIAHGDRPEGAETIYEGRNTLYRLRVAASGNGDSNDIVVKQFKRPNLINAYAYTTVRTSKARRSFENGMRLLELGFLTPEPVAYCEQRSGMKLLGSAYISLELKGATEMRHWERYDNAGTLLPALAAEMVRLERAGVLHKDFTPGNILYTGSAAEGYRFHYVDLNRMEFGVHDHKRMMSMFKAINTDPAETRRLARLYAEAAGLDRDVTEREALSRLDAYLAKRRQKTAIKKLLGRKPSVYQ